MKIHDVLKKDHTGIKAQLQAIDAMGNSKPMTRKAWFLELKTFLRSHAEAEERVFYRRRLTHAVSEGIAREGRVEHAVATRLMATLTRMKPTHGNLCAHLPY